MNREKKMKKVFRNIKSCIRQFDMPIIDVRDDDSRSSLRTKWDDGQHVNELLIVYHGNLGIVSIFSYYNQVPEARRYEAIAALFKLNEKLQKTYLTIDQDNRRIFCYAGIQLKGVALAKKRFRRVLLEILKCVFLYSDNIAEIAGPEQAETGPVEGHQIEVEDYVEAIAT
jgi:hypothetical protein